MKKSNLFLMTLGLVMITGMFSTNVILKKEYQKIDLTDPYKNYISVESPSYSVLDISGSNGYPIKIVNKKTDDIKVLRSRLHHYKSNLKNDTLFIQFTGSNISMEQSYNTSTPAGIIIEKNALSSIIITNIHNRISNFSNQNLKLLLKGNSHMEVSNFHINTMEIDIKNTSQVEFLNINTVDSLHINMENKSIAKLQKIDFKTIKHTLSDSITFVLSKDAFNSMLK